MNQVNTPIHKDFYRLFFRKERRALLGNKRWNFWILCSILFMTFLAIGFANGSLLYLQDKMKDPYVNWVDITVNYEMADNISEIKNNLNESDIYQKYSLKNVTGYYNFSLYFYSYADSSALKARGRSVEFDDPILPEILMNNTLPEGGFRSENEIGLIVTSSFLEKFQYKEKAHYILMHYLDRDIPIPVVGIVKDLPGNSDYISTTYFYYNKSIYGDNPFNPLRDNRLKYYIDGNETEANQLLEALMGFLLESEKYQDYDPFSTSEPVNDFLSGYEVSITFDPDQSINFLDAVHADIMESGILSKFHNVVRNYNYHSQLTAPAEYKRYDHLSVNFEDLNMIRDFATYMFNKYEIQIDMAQVAAKENYNFVTKLTRIISLILIGFSILSICLFLANLLRNHLEKIRMNIGTFKAFGLPIQVLQKIYIQAIFTVIILAMFFSLFIGWLFGVSGGMRGILFLFKAPLENGEHYFQLLHFWTLLCVVLILGVSLLVLYWTAQKIFRKTPGDLIYGR
jgi:ABC-type Fe3+-siderophore transport system permease subunit